MLADLLEDAVYKYITTETTTSGINVHRGFSFDEMVPPCVSVFAQSSSTREEPETLSEKISVQVVVYTQSDQTRAQTTILVDKIYDILSKYDLALNLNNQNVSGIWVNQYYINGYTRDVQEDRIRRTTIDIDFDCCTNGSLNQNHNAQ